MPSVSGDLAAWGALAGIGAFHGFNPAMGWLFSVALGLHQDSRRIVWVSLVPIALGHALSVAAVVLIVTTFDAVIDRRPIEIAAGLLLLAWAAYHIKFGHRHRVRIGMTAGMTGLAVWSFVMATGHGAGLMLIPIILPLRAANAGVSHALTSDSLALSLVAVGVHTAAMLLVTAATAIVVYEWVGVAFLRTGWINLDWIWTAALVLAGVSVLM